VLRSCRTGCRPVSLLAQEAGGPQLRPQVALLFAGGPQYLVGFVFFGERPQEQQDVKKEAFDFGEVSIRAMVQGVRVISWALGGRLRQCPQRLVVEPTGGVKGDGPFLVRAKPAVKVKPHPILVAVLRQKDAVDPFLRFDEKRRLGLLRKVRVVIKALSFVYLKEGN